MKVVIVGGGMAGLVLARALLDRGVDPVVLERLPRDRRIPGPIMLPFQAFDALTDIGAMDEVRARGTRHRAAARRHAGGHRGGAPGAGGGDLPRRPGGP